MSIDKVTAEVIRNGLAAAGDAMFVTIEQTARSPLLYASHDFAAGIVSAAGELWGSAPGVGNFISALSDTIKSGIREIGLASMGEGDVFVVNDPYETGTHISDTSIYAPVFFQGELVGFSIVTAHWSDIGGKTPSGWCADSTSVYQEGLCFSHQRIVRAGERDADWLRFVAANVRFPETVLADLDAQFAACHQGAVRLRALCERYGADLVRQSMDYVIERSRESIRARVAALPDGIYAESLQLDHDGVDPDSAPVVSVQVTIAGDSLAVSFDGSSPATKGPINNPGAQHDTFCALKGLLAPEELDNEGYRQAFDLRIEPGLIVSPLRPAAVDSYGYVGIAVIELVIRAMAGALPGKTPAAGFQIYSGQLSRADPSHGSTFSMNDLCPGGAGARPDGDGPQLVFVGNGDTPVTPVEVIEATYPVRCQRAELMPELAGHGKWRGGAGTRRDYVILEEGISLDVSNQNVEHTLAQGVHGGGDGLPSRTVINPTTPDEVVIPDRIHIESLKVGDVISSQRGGGGGYGDPKDRDRDRIADDIKQGYLTPEVARDVYGY
ncbi:hydantoinase B/oxoprolinase family protein [Kribbella solani]|uniref:N-methylhydantoinase B n=1 Tax=Kribbella solani TaxID=236067 RepID=A0A841E0F4_9ACTN|nr:N-methylhydantoinase B [Kribbella solani]